MRARKSSIEIVDAVMLQQPSANSDVLLVPFKHGRGLWPRALHLGFKSVAQTSCNS